MLTRHLKLTGAILGASLGLLMATPDAHAQFGDLSPVLLVESGPSDNGDYRRMVFVKFLSGDRVSVNYKAYNRTEFIQARNTTPQDVISACANGAATPMSQIKAFQRDEARAKRSGKAPQVVRFCIKNIQNWEGGNRDKYLNPIFEGMPHAASLNN
ncbi:MAG: hypothetical protein ABJN69_12340 [Hellea sp.]